MDPRLVKRMIRLRRMALLLAVLLYLALTLAQLSLPGLHYDEAKEAGINAMEMLQRQDVHAFRSAGLQIGPLFLPLMVQDYIGALNVYLALPLLALFGVTVPALRLVGVLCGLGTITPGLGAGQRAVDSPSGARLDKSGAGKEARAQIREQTPGWTGAIAALLLAASPAFVFWSRQGIFVTNVVVTLAVATVWAGLRWLRTGRTRALYLMAVLAGLGLWAKLLFIWVLGAMVGVALVGWLFSRLGRIDFGLRVPERPARHRLRTLLIAMVLFLAALSPLLLFNLQTAGTFHSMFGNLGQSYYGVQNAAFLDNLAERLGQIGTLLRGDFLWYLGGPFANAWARLVGRRDSRVGSRRSIDGNACRPFPHHATGALTGAALRSPADSPVLVYRIWAIHHPLRHHPAFCGAAGSLGGRLRMADREQQMAGGTCERSGQNFNRS